MHFLTNPASIKTSALSVRREQSRIHLSTEQVECNVMTCSDHGFVLCLPQAKASTLPNGLICSILSWLLVRTGPLWGSEVPITCSVLVRKSQHTYRGGDFQAGGRPVGIENVWKHRHLSITDSWVVIMMHAHLPNIMCACQGSKHEHSLKHAAFC